MNNYRAWHEKNKKYVYFDYEILAKDQFQMQWFVNLAIQNKLEMSTGLFDKNGKEIYVGDKVRWKDYDNFGCCFEYESVVEQEKGGAFITETPDGTGSYYVWGKTEDLEVIGHIHEGEK